MGLFFQYYQGLLIKREFTLQYLAAQISGHHQQPTLNEASGSHCTVSKPDRAVRVVWKPIAGVEWIIRTPNVIRRENVAPHYKASYAKESLSEEAMQPKAQMGPVTLYLIQSAILVCMGEGLNRDARAPEDLEAYRAA